MVWISTFISWVSFIGGGGQKAIFEICLFLLIALDYMLWLSTQQCLCEAGAVNTVSVLGEVYGTHRRGLTLSRPMLYLLI